ncbi:GEVED domain-containing protein, partial [Wandonia haliotis]
MKKNLLFSKAKYLFQLIGTGCLALFTTNGYTQQSGCNPLQPYDQIQSGFHTTIATRPDGTFLIWGSGAHANGNGSNTVNHLTPVQIAPNPGTPSEDYAYTGIPLFATLATRVNTAFQGFILSTDGLWSWGANSVAVGTGLDNVAGFSQIDMPVGVTPLDVKNMSAAFGALVILTHSGDVWVSATHSSFNGIGGTTPGAGDNYWSRVTRSITGNPPLSGVTEFRITSAGAFAVTTTGQWYTWGPATYLGDGSAVTERNRATPMTKPFMGSPVMIAMTRDCSTTNPSSLPSSTRASYFAIDPADGKLYALGGNTSGQLGQNNTAESTGWVPVQNPTNTGDLDNVTFVAGNDHDAWTTQTGAVACILTSGEVYAWGSNNNGMVGGPTGTSFYSLPRIPQGFNPGDIATYVEVGGHTTATMKQCATRYCYVGHKINGSMGDGVNSGSQITSFDCANTPEGFICGSSTYDAGDAPISYENGNPATHYYVCGDEIYLGTLPPDPDNGMNNNVASGANNMGANGDNANGADEDGLVEATLIHTATNPNFSTTLTYMNNSSDPANIYAWIDWNDDGVFSEDESFIATGLTPDVNPQNINLSWTGITTSCGYKYMRIRISTNELIDDPGTTNIDERSFSPLIHGEVEDYFIDVDIASNPSGDCDGDGVTNGDEIADGTNPNDPCSFIITSQSLTPDTNWATSDCDGDGVINGTEIIDGTNPLDPCDLVASSITLAQSSIWLDGDCDGDGVINGDEVTDGTDPNDPCDFIVASQSIPPAATWENADCDGDGVTNGTEVTNGTDPLNPCELVLANQTLTPDVAWSSGDCDGDGVTNEDEITDGTDLNDPCDYSITSITLTQGGDWNNVDCDEDGVTNGTEITDGTNPNDPCDYSAASQVITNVGAMWNTADCDGDGVTNEDEITDGTNPNDPCDYTVSSVTLPQGGDWNAADCDGDGVTNGDETTDGTNVNDPCDYTAASITLPQGGDWNAADCDGDGVTNEDETTDGTNPNDPCDYTTSSITLTQGGSWLAADCDEDGVTNGDELTDGTDPNDPCDYNVSSQVIANVGAMWNAADCDGDGVTNGDETTDGTNVNDPCDYTAGSITLPQGGNWNA